MAEHSKWSCSQLTGALVESEPHYFGGGLKCIYREHRLREIKKTFSTPEGAKSFVEGTGIDTYAALL